MFSKGRSILLGVLLVASAAAGAWLVLRQPASLEDGVFDKRTTVVELPVGTGSIRTVELYEDGRTRKHGVEENSDGSTHHFWYRRDGTLERAQTLAKPDDNGNRAVLRMSQMAADGVTFLTDASYHANGNQASDIALFADGKTTRRTYWHDNGQVAKDQLMTLSIKTWKVTSEDAFRADGTKARVFRIESGIGMTDKLFGPNELLVASKTHDFVKDTYKELWYADDGVSVQREVSQDSTDTVVLTRRADGTVSQKTLFEYGEVSKAMTVTVDVLDKQGRLRFRQNYFLYENVWNLRSVDIYDKTGERQTQVLVLHTSGPEIGTVEYDNIYPADGSHLQRHYRKDGTLVWEKHTGQDKTVRSDSQYSEQDGIRHPGFNPDLSQYRILTELPPQVVKYEAPRD